MAVRVRQTKKGPVYWIAFQWKGKRVYERSGTDRRVAERLERQRRTEVKDGTYTPKAESVATTVGQFAQGWLDKRRNRSADDDRRWLKIHVLPREWFASTLIVDVRPRDIAKLVEEIKLAPTKETGRPLSGKSISNVYGVLRTMFRDARLAEVTTQDPCAIPRGTISRRVVKRRSPYEAAEAAQLMNHGDVPLDAQAFNAIAFYTGCREGEVCGRRFRDWDRSPSPLGALRVATQYDDQPLKTDDESADHPRAVPVHPKLAERLADWWRTGFELVYCRPPTLDDFIVPHRKTLAAHTKSSAYKMWRRSCDASGVENRTLHSTRHTFVSLARRGGARKDVVEQITHNAKGDIVDAYTTWDWKPLCEAVTCLDIEYGYSNGYSDPNDSENTGGGAGNRSGRPPGKQHETASNDAFGGSGDPLKAPVFSHSDADCAASPLLVKTALALAALRVQEDDFDRLWAESLGIEVRS